MDERDPVDESEMASEPTFEENMAVLRAFIAAHRGVTDEDPA